MMEFKCEIFNMFNDLKKEASAISSMEDFEHILLATKLDNNYSEEIFRLVNE